MSSNVEHVLHSQPNPIYDSGSQILSGTQLGIQRHRVNRETERSRNGILWPDRSDPLSECHPGILHPFLTEAGMRLEGLARETDVGKVEPLIGAEGA